MLRYNNEHEGIGADSAKFKIRFLNFLTDQAQRRSALFNILHNRNAITHCSPDVDARIFFLECRQQGWEEAFAGDRTGRKPQIAPNGRPEGADVRPRLPVQVEDLPGILIEPLAGITERNPSGPATEKRDAKLFFEHCDSLAYGRLCDAQVGRGGGEAAALRDRGERCEMQKLCKIRASPGFDHEQILSGYDATRATYPGRGGWSVELVVVNVNPPKGVARSILQDFGNVGHDGTYVLIGQIALVGVVDLDRMPVPHQDRDFRVLGELVVGGAVGALANG